MSDVSVNQVKALVEKVCEECPEIGRIGTPIQDLITGVVDDTGAYLNSIEAALTAAAGITHWFAATIMSVGAMSAVLDSLPPSDVRAKIYRAGRAVGRFMADRIAEKIREKIGDNN